MEQKLILFDGNALLHRAYHAFPQTLRTSSGELTNAIYGFTSTLLSVIAKQKPSHVIVAFDEKAPTFRHQQFAGYKASRPKMDEELASQIERTREVVRTMNIPLFAIAGFEADDVLGTLAKQAEENNISQIIIVTGDRDALQLITDKIMVLFPSRGKQPEQLFTKDHFQKSYGFNPIQLIDYKALVGDSSDEIPGVVGIGPKIATKLIKQFGNLETIYNNIDVLEDAIKDKLVKYKEIAFLSKQLATIITSVPVKFNEEKSLLSEYNKEEVIDLFLRLEFKSLIKRLPNDSWEEMVENTVKDTNQHTLVKKNEPAKDQMKLF